MGALMNTQTKEFDLSGWAVWGTIAFVTTPQCADRDSMRHLKTAALGDLYSKPLG